MLAEFKRKLKIEAEVIEGKRGISYSALKKLGAQSNYIVNNVFTLPAHAEDDLSWLADYFSKISQQIEPV